MSTCVCVCVCVREGGTGAGRGQLAPPPPPPPMTPPSHIPLSFHDCYCLSLLMAVATREQTTTHIQQTTTHIHTLSLLPSLSLRCLVCPSACRSVSLTHTGARARCSCSLFISFTGRLPTYLPFISLMAFVKSAGSVSPQAPQRKRKKRRADSDLKKSKIKGRRRKGRQGQETRPGQQARAHGEREGRAGRGGGSRREKE